VPPYFSTAVLNVIRSIENKSDFRESPELLNADKGKSFARPLEDIMYNNSKRNGARVVPISALIIVAVSAT
jgi:hypothetical protein